MRAACDDYLTDPDDDTKYTLDPHSREVMVLYEEHERGAEKPKRKRESLEVLLRRLELKKGLGITVERTEIKFSDPRKLILDSLDRFDKHLRMLGHVTGEFKQPQTNPVDSTAVVEEAVCVWCDSMKDQTGEKFSRDMALYYLGQTSRLKDEVAQYIANLPIDEQEALAAWNKPYSDSSNGNGARKR